MSIKYTALSQLFAHRKTGAYFRFQKEAQKIKELWLADLLKLEANLREKWGTMSNAALIQNRLNHEKIKLEQEVRQLLKLLDAEYQQELLRIAASLGGTVQDTRVCFSDGSSANMPTHLTFKDRVFAGLCG